MHASELNRSRNTKKNVLQVILDEPTLFAEKSLGSVMVRGEVVVHFSNDTPIQGPIELVFEGIQRFQTWPEIMKNRPLGNPIETKIQTIELSLPPPNSNGIMPAGIQRFPFEFPIPASLPATILIQNRIEILYRVSATLLRSFQADQLNHTTFVNWIAKSYQSNSKKKYTHSTPLRIIRPVQSIISERPIINQHSSQNAITSTTSVEIAHSLDNALNSTSSNFLQMASLNDDALVSENNLNSLWNRCNLSEYEGLDMQYDQFSLFLAGKTTSNFSKPIDSLHTVHGIRYKIGIDRTAIVLGTSVGIEVMIEPTFCEVKIRSILLNITEKRRYKMKIPADHSWDVRSSETRTSQEEARMILKWAYSYQTKGDRNKSEGKEKISATSPDHIGCNFVHHHSEDYATMAYFEPSSPSDPSSKLFFNRKGFTKQTRNSKTHLMSEIDASSSYLSSTDQELMNLKELNHTIKPGEYFGGRFVMPVPGCDSILHPSMDFGSIKIKHWLQLTVILECNGKVFEVDLESPMHMLDCQLVAADDEKHTILLPPPPSYQAEESSRYHQSPDITSTFWEQREPITYTSSWGKLLPCPCELRKTQKNTKYGYEKLKNNYNTANAMLSRGNDDHNSQTKPDTHTPSLLHEWGPPPCYPTE
ncbi:hypothetical protein G6F66_008592 [Rhizopus arrhizus]|nr:hypothetical protein G6F66_008592 [Rhizopus arrhizus]